MDLRHDVNHDISPSDMITIQHRLTSIVYSDPHYLDGKYFIRSLYFDNPADKALREKIDGMNCREKFRIRYYNGDTSVIHLEKKSKTNNLGNKQSAPLTSEQAQNIVNGKLESMLISEYPRVRVISAKMSSN